MATFADNKGVKKILLVIGYYSGDADQAEALCDLIADMEIGRNTIADILLYARNDTGPLSDSIVHKLKSKFQRVHQHRCRRMNAKGYPQGPNEMWYDLVEFFRRPEWQQNYYCWYNLEADCVPLDRRWITKIGQAYRDAVEEGKTILGHIHSHGASGIPLTHVNGSAVYGFGLFEEAGGLGLIGGPAQWAYDFHHAGKLVPLAKDTPLIYMDYNRKTITASDLWALRKSGIAPVVLHGVKDASALHAVRAKFIDKSAPPDLSERTICTYFDALEEIPRGGEDECIAAWKEAWTTAGWNPVVSNRFDAYKHPRYSEFAAKVESFGLVRVKGYNMSRFLRWLAFDYQGAGLHCEYDVMPVPSFQPEELQRGSDFAVLQHKPQITPSMVVANRIGMEKFIEAILGFTPTEPVTTDTAIIHALLNRKVKWITSRDIVRAVGEKGWEKSDVVHFSHSGSQRYSPGTPRGAVMQRWYRAVYQPVT